MKKITIIFLMLTVLTFFVAAEEDLLGLDVGAELGFGDIADEVIFGFGPVVRYSNSFNNFDLYFKGKYIVAFDDPLVQKPYLEAKVAYNLPAGPGTLSIIGWTVNNFTICDGESTYANSFIEPSVKYSQDFDFGKLFVQPGFSIWYSEDVDSLYNLSLNLGYYNKGFGAELKGWYNIDPVKEMWLYELFLNYEKGPFYIELDIYTDKEFDSFELYPYIEYSITNRIAVWLGVNLTNIGGDYDTTITPYIGGVYKF